MRNGKIKVLIIDDSAVMRRLLTDILSQADDIEVVGTAQDPLFAMNKITNLRPDVITLDIEMPRMDGLTFLKELMKTDPLPVVMISALTREGCEITLRALEVGAVDFIAKPESDVASGMACLAEDIIGKVRTAARAKVRAMRHPSDSPQTPADKRRPTVFDTRKISTTDKVIAIGASTGGTQAITRILMNLPESIPGIVIVQHMPPLFTRSFAERLNAISGLDVKEAATGDRVLRGVALIAMGNKHIVLKRNGAMYYVEIMDGPMVNFVRPSVDVFFRSVAHCAGKNALGVILTGMGEDGARGMLEMKCAGASTIAQDEESCVIFGMPKKAIELGAADTIAPLDEIPHLIAGHMVS